MEDLSDPIRPPVMESGRPRRRWVAATLGVLGGGGAIGGMWMPLATLAGLGPVGSFDYSHARVYACIAAASFVVVFSSARCFRIVLTAAGILCGLLLATGIDLYQALRDVMGTGDGELAQMARQMVAHSSLQVGAYVLPLCGVACVVAGMLGSSTPRPVLAITSES